MNVAHHSVYPVWMELARTELLRGLGAAYRELEASGVLFVVAKMGLRYLRPAYYDDALAVTVRETGAERVKLEHAYTIARESSAGRPVELARATTTLVCVDREGQLQRIPEWMRSGA